MEIIRARIRMILEQVMEVANQVIQSFDLEIFRGLKTFRARIDYCQRSLVRISSGSSRIVYDLGNGKVLKIARNRKGLYQNQKEAVLSEDWVFSSEGIIAKVLDGVENGEWIISEKARKLTAPLFKKITGYSWEEFIQAINYEERRLHGKESVWNSDVASEELMDRMWNDEDGLPWSVFNIMGNYTDLVVGDLKKMNSWGVVERDGDLEVVLVDYGLDDDIWDAHY